MAYTNRAITESLLEALEGAPAVFLNGPRQSGKTTLVTRIAERLGANYLTFDEATVLAGAQADPESFVDGLETPVVLDEVQLAPEIFRALKRRIDELRRENPDAANGAFLLTGSANVMALPELSEALVGRMQIRSLYPFTMGEHLGLREGFLGGIFADQLPQLATQKGEEPSLDTLIHGATYPEIAGRPWRRQRQWFEGYIASILQRDVRALSEIEKVGELPNILRLLSTRVGNLINDADLARDAGLTHQTLRRYRTLLGQLFLYAGVPPWFRNIGKRFVKAPKAYIADTALLCHLLGIEPGNLAGVGAERIGPILENFVGIELIRQLAHVPPFPAELYHLRTHSNVEVDFVIERQDGALVGIEVKARQTVGEKDFRNLVKLRHMAGGDFKRGIVLHRGAHKVPFGKDMVALPVSALWRLGAQPM